MQGGDFSGVGRNRHKSADPKIQQKRVKFCGRCFYKKENNICLGAQSFEHANVSSEKINFSALGGPKVAIFGRDDLDPIYFAVSYTHLTLPTTPYV